jgi:predicted small secreted protein
MKQFIKSILVVAFALTVLSTASGCKNTASGFGKDVENAGEKIQEKVD